MTTHLMRWALCLVCLSWAACSRGPGEHSQHAEQASGAEAEKVAVESHDPTCCSLCPLSLAGAKIEYEEHTGGAAILFRAPDAELEELRRRVRQLAEHHDEDGHKLAMITLPHSAEAVAVDGGARLDLTVGAMNDLEELQRSVQNQVEWMRDGNCPTSANAGGCGACQSGD